MKPKSLSGLVFGIIGSGLLSYFSYYYDKDPWVTVCLAIVGFAVPYIFSEFKFVFEKIIQSTLKKFFISPIRSLKRENLHTIYSDKYRGIKFALRNKEKVFSIAPGVVKRAENSIGYEKHVIIEHKILFWKFNSVYAYLGMYNVKTGDMVKKDQLLGETGVAIGKCFHFELRLLKRKKPAIPLDPEKYINLTKH